MTLEFLADMAALEARGKKVRHPLRIQAKDLLYDAIRKMVYKMSLSYAQSCRVDVDDLAQDCMKRIVQRIGDYDSRVAKFTTWAWTVCRSVLNATYRRQSGWNTHVVGTDVGDLVGDAVPRMDPDESGILRYDIISTVQELARLYPRRRRLIMELFGNPEKKGFTMPSRVMVAHAAREVGVSYVTAHVFYKKVVQPFFRLRFAKNDASKQPVESQGEDMNVGTGGMNIVDAALTILKEMGRPMKSRELFEMASRRRLYISKAMDPCVSFIATLRKAVVNGETRLEKESGMWRAVA